MTDCGRDAHAHVRECRSNANAGTLHGSFEQFEEIHRGRRRDAVQTFLCSLPQDDAAKVCLRAALAFLRGSFF